MGSADDRPTKIRECGDRHVAAAPATWRLASDPYHSSVARRSRAIGRYASAQPAFSSAWAASAPSSRSCSATSSVRRRAAAIVALTLRPLASADERTTATRSAGRLTEIFTNGADGSPTAYGATVSWKARALGCVSLMV